MSVQYTGGCAVRRGMFSTLGDVQYTGGCSVHWGMFSTLGDLLSTPEYTGGYHEYAGGVQYTGGYHEYTGGIQYSGGYHSTAGDTMMSVGGYHEYTRGCSVHWGFHTNSIVFPMTFLHIYHDIPSVLMIPPSVLNTPTVLMISPGVLNSPGCTVQTQTITLKMAYQGRSELYVVLNIILCGTNFLIW